MSEELVEKVPRRIWTTSQDHVVGNRGTYSLKMRMSWDEAKRAAQNVLALPEFATPNNDLPTGNDGGRG